MTTLVIQTEPSPLWVHWPANAEMTATEFYDFCQANPDLRIERSAQGHVLIRPPAFSDTGKRNLSIGQQLARSASDAPPRLQAKLEEYIANGASLGWLIDRQSRQVYIYRPSQSPIILEDPDSVSDDPELPGFMLSFAKIW